MGDQTVEIGGARSGKACKTKAGGHIEAMAIKIEVRGLKLRPDAVNHALGVLLGCVGQNKKEFLPSDTATNVTLSRITFQNFRKCLQNGIACIVSVGVVDSLEVVQVSQGDPEGEPVPSRAAQLPRRLVFNGAAIW